MPDKGYVAGVWVQYENCLQQMVYKKGWNDYKCKAKTRYICQKQAGLPKPKADPISCTGVNCGDQGQCEIISNKPTCICNTGWSGGFCQTKKCRFVVTSGGLPEKADVVIVLDGSGSVSTENFDKSLEFVINFVDKMKIGADAGRVSLVQFSSKVKDEVCSALAMGLSIMSDLHTWLQSPNYAHT